MNEIKLNKKKNKKIYIYFSFLFKIVFFFPLITLCSQCDYYRPFLKDGTCQVSCSNEELDSGDCIIENEILKTQWIDNIIYLSDTNYIYMNMVTSQNEDLIIVVSSSSSSELNKRLFYGIDKEGRGYFKLDNKEQKIYINSLNGDSCERYESEIFMVKFQSLGQTKEYIFDFGKASQLIQIYDIENYITTYKKDFYSVFLLTLYDIRQIIGAKVVLTSSNDNYYLIGLLYKNYVNSIGYNYLCLIKFKILDITYITLNKVVNINVINTSNSKCLSCYETSNYDIICFYQNNVKEYTVGAFSNDNLQFIRAYKLQNGNDNQEIFYKSVHFYDEIGAFIYYSNDEIPLANLAFIKFCHYSQSFSEYYNKIIFNDYSFYYNLLLNDIIKVTDKKIYFVTMSLNKYDLYIISLHNYDEEKIIYRIYKTTCFLHYSHYFYNTIRLEIYNNFLAFGANGFTHNSISFSSLTIFSYPNSTDTNKEIIDLLLNDNELKIGNICLNIKDLCKIENNIFGLILTGIEIDEIYKNTNEYLSLDDGTELSSGMFIGINETLNLNIYKTGEIYAEFNYGIKYVCQATEPEFIKYNKYAIETHDFGTTNKAENFFESEKKTYSGRHSYFYFLLNDALTDVDCDKTCELCYNAYKDKCITCIYNDFEILGEYKNCNEVIITTLIQK